MFWGGLEKPLANSFLVKGHQIVINQAISLKFLDDFKGEKKKKPKTKPLNFPIETFYSELVGV